LAIAKRKNRKVTDPEFLETIWGDLELMGLGGYAIGEVEARQYLTSLFDDLGKHLKPAAITLRVDSALIESAVRSAVRQVRGL